MCVRWGAGRGGKEERGRKKGTPQSGARALHAAHAPRVLGHAPGGLWGRPGGVTHGGLTDLPVQAGGLGDPWAGGARAARQKGRKERKTNPHRTSTSSCPPPPSLSAFFLPVPRRYLTLAAATAVLGVGLTARPDSSIATWAKGEAAKELGE